MMNQIIIVENFYSNPDAVRALAIQSNYKSAAKLNYPGYESQKKFNSTHIKKAFEKLIGKEIEDDEGRYLFGGFRLITEETGAILKVHADTIIDWAGLVFLTPNAPLDAGLGIFKHKETGLISPPSDEEARELGFEDANEFEKKVVRRDMADFSKWELVSYVGPVYNRLVLFRGSQLYHAPLKGFGTDPSNCRITHNFFFREKVKTENENILYT